MAEDEEKSVDDAEERVADAYARSYKKDRQLDEKLSSENPDRVRAFNTRADRKREKYSKENYYESTTGQETERRTGED